MGIKKVVIFNRKGDELGVVSANVETGYMIIDGRPFEIKEVKNPSRRFEACFDKGSNHRLYPQ
ncbi:hypothetical protein [Cedecea neteri]|uniref:hypothetical protein n=1 Tax=Cedecea neteri TaxID=158822 RepID=UPI0008FFD0C4|nr:hypothetical protein [Cedecea neteri]